MAHPCIFLASESSLAYSCEETSFCFTATNWFENNQENLKLNLYYGPDTKNNTIM
jgi:hypothetical protein